MSVPWNRAIAAFPGKTVPGLLPARQPAAPQGDEVLCRTLQLGVCGTDREILHSSSPACPAGDDHLALGHECLAVVEETGPEVSDFAPGDLVVPVVRRPNISTASKGAPRRTDMLALGQFTERGIFYEHGFSLPRWLDRPAYLYRIDPAIESVAVLAEPLAVSEKAVNEAILVQRARLGDNEWTAVNPPRVLVTGMGPIGFTAVIASICRGWPVTMFGRDRQDTFRAQLAQRLGATYTNSVAEVAHPVAEVAKTSGSGFSTNATNTYDLILECTGSDEVMLAAAQRLAPCGVMVWLGSSRVPEPSQHNVARQMRDAVIRNQLFLGTVNAAGRDFEDALAHLAELHRRQPADLAALITARVAPQDALWHYENREPQGIKTIVVYD